MDSHINRSHIFRQFFTIDLDEIRTDAIFILFYKIMNIIQVKLYEEDHMFYFLIEVDN